MTCISFPDEVMAGSKAADLLLGSHAVNSFTAPMGNDGKSASPEIAIWPDSSSR